MQAKLRSGLLTVAILFVCLIGFGAAYKIRTEAKKAALHACLASINAKLPRVTIFPPSLLKRFSTDNESVVLSYDEAMELFQQVYGELDCGCYDTNRVPCDGPGSVVLLGASSNAFGVHFEAFVQAADGKRITTRNGVNPNN